MNMIGIIREFYFLYEERHWIFSFAGYEYRGEAGMTFAEAKKLYFKYDCSLFAMAREEDKEVYKNYKLLGIPDIVEEEWREELFIVLWEQFKIERTGSLFDRMAEIAEKNTIIKCYLF